MAIDRMGRTDKILLGHPRDPCASWFSEPGIWTGRNSASLPSAAFPFFHKRWLLLWGLCSAAVVRPSNRDPQPLHELRAYRTDARATVALFRKFLLFKIGRKKKRKPRDDETLFGAFFSRDEFVRLDGAVAPGEAFINVFTDQHCQMFQLHIAFFFSSREQSNTVQALWGRVSTSVQQETTP